MHLMEHTTFGTINHGQVYITLESWAQTQVHDIKYKFILGKIFIPILRGNIRDKTVHNYINTNIFTTNFNAKLTTGH